MRIQKKGTKVHRDQAHKANNRQAVEKILHEHHPKFFVRYQSICENFKKNRNTQIASIILCALSAGYLAYVLEYNLLFAYVLIVTVCFLFNACRTCFRISHRIENILQHYSDKHVKTSQLT